VFGTAGRTIPNVGPTHPEATSPRDARHRHLASAPVEAHRADPIGPVVAHDVHLQLVEKRPAREAPRDEGALLHALRVPGQRHHHARVVVSHAHQAPPHVHPHGKRARSQPERPHHRLLGPSPEARGREERCQPVRARLALACHHGLLVQEQGPPLPAHPHGGHYRAPVHLVHPAKAVGVPVVAELAHRAHPAVPLPNVRLHVLQRPSRVPRAPQVRPHALRHPVLVPADPFSRHLSSTPRKSGEKIVRPGHRRMPIGCRLSHCRKRRGQLPQEFSTLLFYSILEVMAYWVR
jgi:hypothetical protein